MEIIIDRFDKCQIYAFFAKNLMNDKTLITYFLILIKKTGKYTRAYEDWMDKNDTEKTYANLKEYWREEHLKMKHTNPSAKQYGYSMNVTAEPTQEPNQPDMATILEQCANATMAGQKQQQERQQQFETAMAANMTALQNQLQQSASQQQQMVNAAMQQQMENALQQQSTTDTANNKTPSGNWQSQAWNSMQHTRHQYLPPSFSVDQQSEQQ